VTTTFTGSFIKFRRNALQRGNSAVKGKLHGLARNSAVCGKLRILFVFETVTILITTYRTAIITEVET